MASLPLEMYSVCPCTNRWTGDGKPWPVIWPSNLVLSGSLWARGARRLATQAPQALSLSDHWILTIVGEELL